MAEDSKDLSERIWNFFSSMKLGLALLGILAFVSGIGTVVPQTDVSPKEAEE